MTITEPGRVARRAASEQLDEVARRTVEQFAKRSRIPGMSLAVATPDRQLFAVAVGLADLATRRAATTIDQYPWFSMTKIATATAAVQLHDDGRPRPRCTHRRLLAHLSTSSGCTAIRRHANC